MPANSKQSAMLRLWEMLKLLPSRGTGKTALEITKALNDAGFRITKRQVERDLKELMEAFPLDCNNTSPPYGWKWVNGASTDLPGLTVAESISLRMVEDTLRPLLPVSVLQALEPRFRQAENRLILLSKENRKAQWVNKVRTVSPAFPLIPPAIDSVVLESVQDALLADEQIEVGYRGMGSEEIKSMLLHPLGMVSRGPVTYLVATTFDYADVRLYAVHRMKSATRTGEPIKRPADFDLDAYIQAGGLHFGNGKTIRLSAWVSEGLARILEETPMSEDQSLQLDGDKIKLMATVMDSWQLTWWLMSQGVGIEVISPVALRKKIAARLADAAAQYESGSV